MAFLANIEQKQSPITIGKVWDKGSIYIGRAGKGSTGSPLANPFKAVNGNTDAEREKLCDRYQVWFDAKVKEHDDAVYNELVRIYRLAQRGPITLGCFCYPKRCHGDTIKAFLDKYLT
jgi:hypothetical protein